MGACVTPSQKHKYPKLNDVPLPNGSTILQPRFKIQPRNPSPQQIGSKIQVKKVTIEDNNFIQPSSQYLIQSQSNKIKQNQLNDLNNKQTDIKNRRQFYNAILQSPRKSHSVKYSQSSINQKQYPSQTININQQSIPSVYRQQSIQQIQPQSVSSNVQKMMQSKKAQNNVSTPNFQESEVTKINDFSNNNNQFFQQPSNTGLTFNPSTQIMKFQPSNLCVDKNLLSFNKNTFQKQLITPVIKNFQYDVSLPHEKNIY